MSAERFAAGLEYDGSGFSGWQNQTAVRTIQGALNEAIAAVADHPVGIAGAGRTDAGVHALGQVIHFDTSAIRSLRSWWLGINSNLPDDVVLHWVRPVPADFHARYSATARTYCYVILNRPVRAALDRNRVWSLREPLAAERMAEAGQALLGEHDFSAFRGAGCQAKSPVRRLDHLRVRRVRDVVQVEIRATGFLYHMVRNIVGGLVRVGTGQAEPGWLLEVLKGRDRSRGAPTAPAQGLYLAEVHYPPALAFPKPPLPAVWRDQ